MIKEKIIDIVSECTGVDSSKINENTRLIEDLDANSLLNVQILIDIEQEFDLEISEEDAVGIKTVGDIIERTVKLSKKA